MLSFRGRYLIAGLLTLALGWGAYRASKPARISVDPKQWAYLGTQKRRRVVPFSYEPWTFPDFVALPALPSAYHDGDWAQVQSYSRRAISLEGYLAEVIRQPDHDLHLHLRQRPVAGCFPSGSRAEQIVTEVTPAFQPPATEWSEQPLLALCQRQARVRISGWLLHDFPHAEHVGQWRVSAWEIHPVTRIEVWNGEGQRWEPLP